MPESEGCTLKDMRDARVEVWVIPCVGGKIVSQKGREVFIRNDVLKCRNIQSPCTLELYHQLLILYKNVVKIEPEKYPHLTKLGVSAELSLQEHCASGRIGSQMREGQGSDWF